MCISYVELLIAYQFTLAISTGLYNALVLRGFVGYHNDSMITTSIVQVPECWHMQFQTIVTGMEGDMGIFCNQWLSGRPGGVSL